MRGLRQAFYLSVQRKLSPWFTPLISWVTLNLLLGAPFRLTTPIPMKLSQRKYSCSAVGFWTCLSFGSRIELPKDSKLFLGMWYAEPRRLIHQASPSTHQLMWPLYLQSQLSISHLSLRCLYCHIKVTKLSGWLFFDT